MSELLSFGNLFGYSIAGCMGCNGFLSPQDDTWSISVFCVLPASHLQRGRRVRFFVKFRSGVVRVIGRLGCQVGRYHLFRSWFPGSWFSHGRVTVLMPVPCDASPLRCQSPAISRPLPEPRPRWAAVSVVEVNFSQKIGSEAACWWAESVAAA